MHNPSAHHQNIGPLKILLLVTQLERGGAQQVALSQARYLNGRGHGVTLAFFYDKQGLLDEVRQAEGFEVIDLQAKLPGRSRWGNLLLMLRAFWRLFRLLRRRRVEVIHTLTHYSNVIGIPIAWLAGVPVRVSSQHNSLIRFKRWFFWLDSFIVNSRLTDKMVAVSEATRCFCVEVEHINDDKLVTIHNGISLSQFDPARWTDGERSQARASLNISPGTRVSITVGRLHEQKGHTYLIDAIPGILAEHPNTRFLFVGDGERREEIAHALHEAGLDDHVGMLGTRPDIPLLLAMSDLFVLPSLYEGLPYALMEAMASELPCVATSVDGCVEVMIPDATGVLVPPGDSAALSAAVNDVLANPVEAARLAENARRRVNAHFSEDSMCQQYETLFQSVYDQKAHRNDAVGVSG